MRDDLVIRGYLDRDPASEMSLFAGSGEEGREGLEGNLKRPDAPAMCTNVERTLNSNVAGP